MNKYNIIKTIKLAEENINTIKKEEIELHKKLYYDDDRYLTEKLYNLEYEEQQLISKIKTYEEKLNSLT